MYYNRNEPAICGMDLGHFGFFLINNTLFESDCMFHLFDTQPNDLETQYQDPAGTYQGPHFQHGGYIIGPSGLIWKQGNGSHIEEMELLHEIDFHQNMSMSLLNASVVS